MLVYPVKVCDPALSAEEGWGPTVTGMLEESSLRTVLVQRLVWTARYPVWTARLTRSPPGMDNTSDDQAWTRMHGHSTLTAHLHPVEHENKLKPIIIESGWASL